MDFPPRVLLVMPSTLIELYSLRTPRMVGEVRVLSESLPSLSVTTPGSTMSRLMKSRPRVIKVSSCLSFSRAERSWLLDCTGVTSASTVTLSVTEPSVSAMFPALSRSEAVSTRSRFS